MNTLKTQFKRNKKSLRDFYYEYGTIALLATGLLVLVCLSYYFSRFIPEDLFANVISPGLHGCIFCSAVIGAVVMHWHIDRIYARRVWQWALIVWAVVEVLMWVAESVFGVSTIVRGVQTIDRTDFIVRDVLALVVLAYPMEVLCPKWLNWWRGVLLVLPSLLIALLDMTLHEDLRVLQILYPLVIAWWLWAKVREYRARVEENYSSLEFSAMPWLAIYLTVLTIIGLSYFYLSFSYHPTRLFTQQWLILLLLVYNTAQIVSRRRPWQETVREEEEEEEEEANKDNSGSRKQRESLEEWMQREKPYLNPDFKLADLTQVLPMNRTYLSQFIKTEYNSNFYQWVVTYRINEAKRLMGEHPGMKMLEVAEQSGFSSPVVFTRTFVRETGCTPTEWVQKEDNPSVDNT